MEKVDDGGPAFPVDCWSNPNDSNNSTWQSGMSLRAYVATKQMAAMLSRNGVYNDITEDGVPLNEQGWYFDQCAKCAVKAADALLAELSKPAP